MSSSNIPSDESYLPDLWTRFRNGEGEAFDELTRRRYKLLFNYATRFSKDTEFIKDCIQDLFLELWYRRESITDTTYVTVYLIKALRNNLLRKLRLQSRLDQSVDINESGENFTDHLTVESILISSESMSLREREIRAAINKLPKRQQEVVFLKFYEGLSNEAIAEVMSIERQTVSNFLHRAISQLKNEIPAISPLLPLLIFKYFY